MGRRSPRLIARAGEEQHCFCADRTFKNYRELANPPRIPTPKRTILEIEYRGRIGDTYQADIPDLLVAEPCIDNNREDALWIPQKSGDPVKDLSRQLSLEGTTEHSNEEALLFSLYIANYSVERARTLFSSGDQVNAPDRTITLPRKPFKQKEWLAFKRGLKMYGKDFRKIQRRYLRDRTVGDLVEVYYDLKQCHYKEISKKQ
ncbi:hypothetical protein QR680_004376 [Steinernema hermaphroditum]|uniref:ELM2 domain-containing protein n=1 Tax=Steinernema hermaphroditum TaxID=289476 RepID=A0AA39LTW1_9BILA|nr:hypothetical protein QR680_004376 [Steinernema hermaphroditum]